MGLGTADLTAGPFQVWMWPPRKCFAVLLSRKGLVVATLYKHMFPKWMVKICQVDDTSFAVVVNSLQIQLTPYLKQKPRRYILLWHAMKLF